MHRTIHGMVYNALKMFMEISPELFDETTHHYKQQKIEFVISFPNPCLPLMRPAGNSNTPSNGTKGGKGSARRPLKTRTAIYQRTLTRTNRRRRHRFRWRIQTSWICRWS